MLFQPHGSRSQRAHTPEKSFHSWEQPGHLLQEPSSLTQEPINSIGSCFVCIVSWRLDCEMCNSSIDVFSHKQTLDLSHLPCASEMPIFYFCPFCGSHFPAVTVISLLLSWALIFLPELECSWPAICCFTHFQCPPPPSLLLPEALELLSLETACTHSFFPELWPAGPRIQSMAHQRPGHCCHSHVEFR